MVTPFPTICFQKGCLGRLSKKTPSRVHFLTTSSQKRLKMSPQRRGEKVPSAALFLGVPVHFICVPVCFILVFMCLYAFSCVYMRFHVFYMRFYVFYKRFLQVLRVLGPGPGPGPPVGAGPGPGPSPMGGNFFRKHVFEKSNMSHVIK